MSTEKQIHIRRYVIFLAGMVLNSIGIAFITRAGLGTSPISGPPFVLSLITGVSLGVYTFVFNMLYLILEAVLRKQFTKEQAMQVLVSLIFSVCVDLALSIIPSQYGHFYLNSVIYLLIGCLIASFGISLEVLADVIMLPAEALVRAIARKTEAPFGNVKIAFDVILAFLAAAAAMIFLHKLNGVREGTIVASVFVGYMVKVYSRHLKFIKVKWLGEEPENESAEKERELANAAH